jgi:hypothetical protein
VAEATGDAAEYIRQMQKTIELDRLDPELPYSIARLLYELELIGEGDRYRSQVNAIAPHSPAAKSLEIIRAIRAEDEEISLEVARQLIRDDVDDRRKAWIRAFRHLMLTAVLRGRTEEELEFVKEYVPSFSDWDEMPGDWKVGLGRAHTLEIWRNIESEQEIQSRVNRVKQGFAALNLPMWRVTHVHVDVLLLEGDLEGAINSALENFYSLSVLERLDFKDRFVTPLYTDFVADPRIIAAMQKWDDELEQAREDARNYLAEQAAE